MKKKTLINSDPIGPPAYVTMDLILQYDEEVILTIRYQKEDRTDYIELTGDQAKELIDVKVSKPVKNGTAKYFDLYFTPMKIHFMQSALLEPDHAYSIQDVEMPIEFVQLALHKLGIEKLDKDQLKKVIINIGADNFEKLKQLKQFGVINDKVDK